MFGVDQPIGHGEKLPGAFGCRDHRLGVGRGGGHRLLAEDMLARLDRADRKLRVQRIGHGDIDELDRRVVGDTFELVVGVMSLGRDVVIVADLAHLLAAAAHEPCEIAVLGLLERG
jgi:hypothetical protein